MKDIIAVLRVGQGEVAIRENCNCGLCRAYRDEPNTVIRTLQENRARAGYRTVPTIEQLRAKESVLPFGGDR